MRIAYSRASRPSALALQEAGEDIELVHGLEADINWGRYRANSQLNPDISNSTNKRVMRELFKEHGVPAPRLYTPEEVLELLQDPDEVKIYLGRPDRHTRGRGMWPVSSVGALYEARSGTARKAAATHFMEYIQAPGVKEYRVHIFRGRSLRISEKDFSTPREGVRHGTYTTRVPEGRKRHIRDAAKAAVAAVGLDFGAVDVLATNDQAWVLEVNSAPGLGGSMPRVYLEAFERYFAGDWE